jgi:hypothetical protein
MEHEMPALEHLGLLQQREKEAKAFSQLWKQSDFTQKAFNPNAEKASLEETKALIERATGGNDN